MRIKKEQTLNFSIAYTKLWGGTSVEANVKRYYDLWDKHQGPGALTPQGAAPKIGLVHHIVLADTAREAVAAARPAWDEYVWYLMTPRLLEADRRGQTQFAGQNKFRR